MTYTIPRYTTVVELSVMKTENVVLVVKDEADLKQQIADYEVRLRAQPIVAKIKRDKQGKVVMQQMNKDWNV